MSLTSTTDLQEQFVKVIDNHQGIIYKVAHAYCQDPDEQKDLVQEIIFQLWKSFRKYDEQFKISTWMYRIALNVAISYLRKNQVRNKHHYPIDPQLVKVFEESHEDMNEELKLLRQFIQGQNKLDQAVLLLYLDEKSHAEMAAILGISVSNVGTKLGRLKQKLKHYLMLRSSIIKYLRLVVWIFPLHMAFVVLFFDLLLGIDIIRVGDQTWIISQVFISVFVMIPLAVWIHQKLVPQNAGKKWLYRILKGNGTQIMDAIKLLEEIKESNKSG